jgi:hypothetical protein
VAMVRVINGSFAFIVAFIRVVLRFQICSNAMSCDATAKRLESSKKVPYLTDLAVRANLQLSYRTMVSLHDQL